jgi:hypothetical protein
VRVFPTFQLAIDASHTFPDHTYVHIVDEFGRLHGVFISINGRLIRIRLENEVSEDARVMLTIVFDSLEPSVNTKSNFADVVVSSKPGKDLIDPTDRHKRTFLEMHTDAPMSKSEYRPLRT